MARARIFRPVTDEAGNLQYGATVTLRNEDASALITQTIYGSATGSDVIENPFVIGSGYLSIWLDTPERLNVLVEVQGLPETTVILDANAPAPEMFQTAFPFKVLNAPVAGYTVVATSDTEGEWQAVPAPSGPVPVHNHEGAGTNSVALGTGASATGSSSTAVGDSATATAAGATSFGYSADATGTSSTAAGVNSSAPGANSTALGENSSASGTLATAVGSGAVSSGAQATALGHAALAAGDNTVALGDSAQAAGAGSSAIGANAQSSADNALALGTGAAAAYANSVAVGPGAATTAADQVALGTAAQTVLAVGDLQILAGASLAGAASTLGFFGSAGAVQQTVSGADGGNLVLRALIDALAALGLIVDSTTP